MANSKELVAKVRLDIGDAESKLKRLDGLLKGINKAVSSSTGGRSIESQLAKEEAYIERVVNKELQAVQRKQQAQWKAFQAEQAAYERQLQKAEQLKQKELQREKIRQQSLKTMGAGDRAAQRLAKTTEQQRRKEYEIWWQRQLTNQELIKAFPLLGKLLSKSKELSSEEAKQLKYQIEALSLFKRQKTAVSGLLSKVKMLASTYLGVMGTKAMIETSDKIIGAQNKLNNLDGATPALTKEAMSKMYTSAQVSRMSYTDMMSNVAKSMTLAGDAFDNNVDNAIRFQEIMAKAYHSAGAQPGEISSSMYQMIQALGSGTLAGDELRSVREGAPLAYKEIEKFAQKIYDTDESLKQLAADGKITSEIVVAAIMNAGDAIDSKFAKTKYKFEDVWNQIKNAATRAFEPVAEMLSDLLDKAVKNGMIQKIEKAFAGISKAIQIAFTAVIKFTNWVIDNWKWIKDVVVGALIAIITWTIIEAGISIGLAVLKAIAWWKANEAMHATVLTMIKVVAVAAIIIAAVIGLIYVFYQWKTGAIDTCEMITKALLIVGAAVLLIGIIVWGTVAAIPMLIIGAVMIIIAVILHFADVVTGVLYFIFAIVLDIIIGIVKVLLAVFSFIIALIVDAVALIINICMGLWNALSAICTNIGIAFENCWIWATNAFWSFIQNCLEGMKELEPAINAIAEACGLEGFSLSATIDKVAGKQREYKQFESVGDAWKSGWNTAEFMNPFDAAALGFSAGEFINPVDAYKLGEQDGQAFKKRLNKWGSQFQTGDGAGNWLDNIGKKLGLNFDDQFGTTDPLNTTSPEDLMKDLGNISDNTDKISDNMDLTSEDLSYLRKLAEMEWKKEYTTANITVDMKNYNTVEGDGDLDGIVTKLTTKLYEELDYMANGVHS